MPNGSNFRGRDGGRGGGRNERRDGGGGRRWNDRDGDRGRDGGRNERRDGGGRRKDDRGGGHRRNDGMRYYPKIIFPPYFYGYPKRRCDWYDRYGRCCDRYGRCCDRYGRCDYIDGYKHNRYLPMGDRSFVNEWSGAQTSAPMIAEQTQEQDNDDY